MTWTSKFSGSGPWIENLYPPNGSSIDPVSVDKISFDIFDDYGVDPYSITVSVNSLMAFDGYSGIFYTPYNGINSSITFVPGGSIDGYDAYSILLDRTTSFGYSNYYTIDIYAEDSYGNILNDSWSFTTINYIEYVSPWLDNQFPSGLADVNTLVSTDILDNTSVVRNSINVYINSNLAYDGYNFVSPYNGSLSSISTTTYDGYDGYKIIIDYISDYIIGSTNTLRVTGQDAYGNLLDDSFNFKILPYASLPAFWDFTVLDYIPPWLANQHPSTPAETDVIVHTDILDDVSGVIQNSLNAYINGVLAYDGTSFIPPFNGSSSSIISTTYDGYDGYTLFIDYTGLYTQASSNTLRVTGRDAYGNVFDESFTFTIAHITGISNLSLGPYEITLDLTFSSNMLNDVELTNPANYHFNNGMYARKVEIIDSKTVRLWVELFSQHNSFTVTVDQNIKNSDGYSLPLTADSYDIIPFSSDATLTNYNSMVRTWHESTIVNADTQRIYLAGVRGIDIFRKNTTSSFSRWAQIFDEYGIDAMYVANYPSDLSITDSTSPYLKDFAPIPLFSYVYPSTHIAFKVRDDITAIEITSLLIYVNNGLVFNGSYGGLQSNWLGNIETNNHELIVEIWPRVNFTVGSTISVRVIAEDLLGNSMDSTYYFYISVPIIGFGGTAFGQTPFGG